MPLTRPDRQLLQNLLGVIRSLYKEDRLWLLRQLGAGAAEPSGAHLADIAMAGRAFNDHEQEPDLYSFSDGEPLSAL